VAAGGLRPAGPRAGTGPPIGRRLTGGHQAAVDGEAGLLLDRFAAAVAPVAGVLGLYAGGSLATGDFRAGVSDFDLVAVIATPLDDGRQQRVQSLHRQLIAEKPLAAKLHCAYVPLPDVTDVAASHLNWAHGELYRRPLSAVARAELQTGLTLLGPPPASLVPPVGAQTLAEGVRAELSGYWRTAVRKPWLWRHDVYVDLGLLTLARAEATLTEGRLITKAEALTRLARWGVRPGLVHEIERRRRGEPVALSPWRRLRRARHARQVVATGIRTLLGD